MPVIKGINTQTIAVSRQLLTLQLAGMTGGWLTPDLAAIMLWHADPNCMAFSYELLAAMVRKKLLLPRPIDGRGRVYVVTDVGAHFAESNGIRTKVGTRWGNQPTGQRWMPPQRFGHDLRAARFMLYLSKADRNSLAVLTRGLPTNAHDHLAHDVSIAMDWEIQQSNGAECLLKLPDGLAVIGDRVYWVEVEASRKDGKKGMGHLCEYLIAIAQGECPYINVPGHFTEGSRKRPTDSIVVFPPLARDIRGTMLNHKKRLVSALKRALEQQRDLIDDEIFVDPRSETRPLPPGMMRTYFVQEITPGQFVMPERSTILGIAGSIPDL